MGLRSEDPWDAPKLDTNYLSDPEGVDLATLRCFYDTDQLNLILVVIMSLAEFLWLHIARNGLKLARRISQTAPLAGITEREGHPGVELQAMLVSVQNWPSHQALHGC